MTSLPVVREGEGGVAGGDLPALWPRGHGRVAAVDPARDDEGGAAVVKDLPRRAGVGDVPVCLDGPGGGVGRQGEVVDAVVGHSGALGHDGAARPVYGE